MSDDSVMYGTATYSIKTIKEASIVDICAPNLWQHFWGERDYKVYFLDQDGEEHMFKVWLSSSDVLEEFAGRVGRKLADYIVQYNNRFTNPLAQAKKLIGMTINVEQIEEKHLPYELEELFEDYVRSNNTVQSANTSN